MAGMLLSAPLLHNASQQQRAARLVTLVDALLWPEFHTILFWPERNYR
jgi:hypothetical protein